MLDVERLQFLDLYSFELRLDYFEKILEFTSSSYSFYWLDINDNLNMYINDHLRMYTSDYALI